MVVLDTGGPPSRFFTERGLGVDAGGPPAPPHAARVGADPSMARVSGTSEEAALSSGDSSGQQC